jgi:hypothetical protein
MSRDYSNLTHLVEATSAKDCSVHLHLDDNGKPVFSVGHGNIGAAEFSDYFDALQFITDRNHTAADCAEQAGHLIAENVLSDILNRGTQAERSAILSEALLSLATMPHPERAAGGFAVALLPVLEVGLKNLPKVSE